MDQEEKARFGELCSAENGKGREWFARFVSAQVTVYCLCSINVRMSCKSRLHFCLEGRHRLSSGIIQDHLLLSGLRSQLRDDKAMTRFACLSGLSREGFSTTKP